MKKILIFILFLLPVGLKAQSVNVDSLVHVLETQKLSDDDKISIYNNVCYFYLNSDPEKAMSYCQEALSFAKKINNPLTAGFYTYIGTIHQYEGDYDKAHEYYNQALDYAMKRGAESVTAFVYGSIAGLYNQEGKTITALDYFFKALSLYEKGDTDNHKRQQITMLTNIGTLRSELEDLDLAIQSFEKAEKTAIELNDSEGIMQIYYNLGNIYIKKNESEKALNYVLKSLELSRSVADKRFECGNLGLLALIYKSPGFTDLAKAEEYANEGLDIAKQMNFPLLLKGSWHILANVYLAQKRYAESETANITAWESDSLSTTVAFQIHYDIGMANMHLGNKEKATYYLDKSRGISKKTTNKSFQSLFHDMEVKYETEKKEMRIAALEKENTLYIGLGVAITIALLSIIGLLFYRHRSAIQNRKIAEQKIIQLEQEKKLIAVQSSLKAEKAERDLIAHDLHDSVSSLLTVTKNNMSLYLASDYKNTNYFNNAFEVLSKSITELRRVVYHLKSFILTKEGLVAALDDFCRFIPNAEFHFKGLDRRFHPDKEYVLYDCACELINNALKHSGASRIDIHLNVDEQTVYLSVADNGTGFDSGKIKQGIGLDNICSNLAAFGGHLEILSEPDKGTEANVELEV